MKTKSCEFSAMKHNFCQFDKTEPLTICLCIEKCHLLWEFWSRALDSGQIETPPSAVLFLCPSHVISKPTETELDNNLNTERAQQVRNFTHYTTTTHYYCTN